MINLGKDSTICLGTSLTLDAGEGYQEYRWQDGSSDRFLRLTAKGLYTAQAKNEFGCWGKDSIVVSVKTIPHVELGRDTLVCSELYTLNAGREGSSYRWSSGSTDSLYLPSESGKYWVTVSNNCGEVTDSIRIYRMNDIVIPNVVTSNQDNCNDIFQIEGVGDVTLGRLKIYDRWGQLIFEEDQYQSDWPKDPNVPPGTYFFILSYLNCSDFKGWVEVVR
jgi:gliding motility-associated-like protein